jgi:hypothetical protein
MCRFWPLRLAAVDKLIKSFTFGIIIFSSLKVLIWPLPTPKEIAINVEFSKKSHSEKNRIFIFIIAMRYNYHSHIKIKIRETREPLLKGKAQHS